MGNLPRFIFFIAMIMLGIVSMWTTYMSLHDSILPTPVVNIPFSPTLIVPCSIFALALSVAIGLMLFALKMSIIDEQKRLNIVGVIGMTCVAFISIAFNIDVLYRTADHDFFQRFSTTRMKTVYEDYLTQVQGTLNERRQAALMVVATQEGELESEVKGLREKPAGYGPVAKNEDHYLTVLKHTSEVDLKNLDEAFVAKQKADELLATTKPQTINEIDDLQHQLRVVVKDLGAIAGVPLPEPVRFESPIFAVFTKLFDFKQIGLMEIFIVIVGFMLDLGDIIGYTLIPTRRKRTPAFALAALGAPTVSAYPALPGPEVIPSPSGSSDVSDAEDVDAQEADAAVPQAAVSPGLRFSRRRTKRPMRFGRH